MSHRNVFAEEAVLLNLPAPVDYSAEKLGLNIKGRGTGVKIAIVDTGKPDHVSIPNINESINFATSYTAADTVGQSTIVAGIIGGYDTESVIGIAPESELLFAKISGDNGKVGIDSLIAAYLWCIIKGVDVIVMPMTTDNKSDVFKETIEKCAKANICIVSSAGYRGYTQFPSSYPNVLSVGALKQDGELANFSAPGRVGFTGTSVTSTYIKQNYCITSGSSIATAFIGGLTALIVAKTKANRSISPKDVYIQVEAILQGRLDSNLE